MEDFISNRLKGVPLSIYEPFKRKQAAFDYIKHPVILEMCDDRKYQHFKIIPDESNKFFLLDGSDFAKSDYVFPVVDVLMFPNGSTIKFDKQLIEPGVCGSQHLSGNEEKVNAIFTYDPFLSGQMAIEEQQKMLEAFKGLETEMQNNFKGIIAEEFKWMYEVDYHNIPHLYNQRTGISLCGKENVRNIPLTELFPNEGYINKCKLCLRTKIGRILQ